MQTITTDFHPIMPMGFFSMAACLENAGIRTRIYNLAVEKTVNPAFRLSEMLRGVRIVAIDLHWYLHSYSVIELAKEIRLSYPDIKIILGGYTSSFFYEEILRDTPEIDNIITGEGEVPIVEYARAVLDGGDIKKTSNLAYRDEGTVKTTERYWVASQEESDRFVYSRLDLLSNYPTYLKMCMKSPVVNYTSTPAPLDHLFYMSVGKGCVFMCPFCGGSAKSTNVISRRVGYSFRSIDSVARDLENLWRLGCKNIFMGSPLMARGSAFYHKLFEILQARRMNIGLNFEAWSLPDKEFLAAMANSVNLRHSGIVLSPGSGSEGLRKRQRDGRPYYSNQELFDWIKETRRFGIQATVAFTMGLPGETPEDFEETLSLIRTLVEDKVGLAIMACKIDPGSDMYLNPDRYGIVCFMRSFKDYYEHTRALCLGKQPAHPLGYRTDRFSETQILDMQLKAIRSGYMNFKFICKKGTNNDPVGLYTIVCFLGILFNIPYLLNLSMRE